MWAFVEGEICLRREARLQVCSAPGDPIFKDFSGRDSVPGSDATHLIADQAGGRNRLAEAIQNGRTITKITMPIMSSVGTSFTMR
jgi:hypothetical protein